MNLRPGSYDRRIVLGLLSLATVTKLDDSEVQILENPLGDPYNKSTEDFCREYASRFGWEAVCVTAATRVMHFYWDLPTSNLRPIALKLQTQSVREMVFAAGLVHALNAGWEAKDQLNLPIASGPSSLVVREQSQCGVVRNSRIF